ncbi:MAG: hypothetical protein EKK42_34815 [Pseudonocardiaceae bacterium]|nr:MAG: hypothetical protein EKK42_34815 [Pseudonocardiaceae bacterium]
MGAATRELHLPTVRTEAADIAQRERHTHLAYLAEVLAAEVDDRTERRRARRIADARFPRLKRLAEFNIDAVPTIPAATLGHLAAGHYHQPTRDYVERRSAEGLSKREIIRCLKRYIAREIYTHLPRPAALDTSGQLEHAA